MATATVSRRNRSGNSAGSVSAAAPAAGVAQIQLAAGTSQATAAAPQPVDLVSLNAALFTFLGKLAEKQEVRDDLHDGQHSDIKVSIVADVDGHRFRRCYDGSIDVGHTSTRASSRGPAQENVVAWLLSKYNAATRAALLREMADTCRANGGTLPVDAASEEEAKKSLADLRQTVNQTVRGSVRPNFREADPVALGLVAIAD